MAEREHFKEDDEEEHSPADAGSPASIVGGMPPIDFGREPDQHDFGETPDTIEADRYPTDLPPDAQDDH